MKRAGRLVGNIGIGQAATAVSPPSTRLPYTSISAGAKFIQYGELFLNDAANRALYALQRNIELLAANTPISVQRAVLEPESGTRGFSALTDIARGTAIISLGIGSKTAPVWLYHGCKAGDVPNSMRFIRASALDSASSNALDVVVPMGIAVYNGANYATAPQAGSPDEWAGDSKRNSHAEYIAPSLRVRSDVAPYESVVRSATLSYVDCDGFIVDSSGGYSFSALHAIPGVFMEVSGSDELNGLYRVERIIKLGSTSEKVVVSTAGLHKVTVEDASSAVEGRLVRWATKPNNEDAEATDLSCSAYIAAIIGNDLYLTTFSGVSDSSGTLAGATYGIQSTGTVGESDSEFYDNNTLTTNTVLKMDDETFVVTAIRRAGEPLLLPVDEALDGVIAYVRNPVGFLLSPTIYMDSTSPFRGGDYYLECDILTGIGAADTLVPVSTVWRKKLFDTESGALIRHLAKMRDGDVSTGYDAGKAFTPTANMLGPALWIVSVTQTAGIAAELETLIVDGSTLITFDNHPVGGSSSATKARVMQCSGNTAYLLAANKSSWDHRPSHLLEPIVAGGVGVGSTFTISGRSYRVTSIVATPAVTYNTGGYHTVSSGMQAAYDNAFASDVAERGNGYGRKIEIHDGAPIQYLVNTAGDFGASNETISDADFVSAARTKHRTGVSHGQLTSDFGHTNVDGSAYVGAVGNLFSLRNILGTRYAMFRFTGAYLGFHDINTGFDAEDVVPLSGSAPYNALRFGFRSQSILGAIYGIDHSVREVEEPDIRSAVGSGLLRSLSSTFISGNGTVDFSLHFNPGGISNILATWVGPSGEGYINIGDKLVVYYTDASGDQQVFVTSIIGVDGFGVGLADACPAELNDVIPAVNPLIGALDSIIISEGEFIVAGRVRRIPEASITHGIENDDVYIVYNEDTQLVEMQLSTPSAKQAIGGVMLEPIARVTIIDSAVAGIYEIAQPVVRMQNLPVIYVGAMADFDDTDSSYGVGKTHFTTIGAALAFITENNALADRVETGWTIKVVSATVEEEDGPRGRLLPLRIPCDGITIEGASDNAVVEWDVPTHLFNLNARTGVTIRNLTFAYTGSYEATRVWGSAPAATNSGPPISVIAGITSFNALTLDNLDVSGAAVTCLYSTSATSLLTANNIRVSNINCGIFAAATGIGSGELHISDLTVLSSTNLFSSSTTDSGTLVNSPMFSAVYADSMNLGVHISNLRVRSLTALYYIDCKNVTVDGCTVSGMIPVHEDSPLDPMYGIYAQSATTNASLCVSDLSMLLDDNCKADCIRISSVDNAAVSKSVISGGINGVNFSGVSGTLRISKSTIEKAAVAAISSSTGTHTALSNCHIFTTPVGLNLSNNASATIVNTVFNITALPNYTYDEDGRTDAPTDFSCVYTTGVGASKINISNCSTVYVEHEYDNDIVGEAIKIENTSAIVEISDCNIHGGVTAISSTAKVLATNITVANRTTATASTSPIISLFGSADDSKLTHVSFKTTANRLLGHCIDLASVDGVVISGITAGNVHNSLIYAANCDDLSISAVIVDATSTHNSIIRLDTCSGVSVHNVLLSGVGKNGGTLKLLEMLSCSNFSVDNFVSSSISAEDPANTVTPLYFYNCSNGTIRGVVTNDLYLLGATSGILTLADCSDIAIAACRLPHSSTASERYGLVLKGVDSVTQNIRLSNVTTDGFRAFGCSGDILFSNCIINATNTAGTDIGVKISGTSDSDARVVFNGGEIYKAVSYVNSDLEVNAVLELNNLYLEGAGFTCTKIGAFRLNNVGFTGASSISNVTSTVFTNVRASTAVLQMLTSGGANTHVTVIGSQLVGLGSSDNNGDPLGTINSRAVNLNIRDSEISCLAVALPTTVNIRSSSFDKFYIVRQSGVANGDEELSLGSINGSQIGDLNVRIVHDDGVSFPQDHADYYDSSLDINRPAWCRLRFVNCDFSGAWVDNEVMTGYAGVISCDSGVTIYNSIICDLVNSLVRITPDKNLGIMPQWYNIEVDDSF